jgi:hypothetical protein
MQSQPGAVSVGTSGVLWASITLKLQTPIHLASCVYLGLQR